MTHFDRTAVEIITAIDCTRNHTIAWVVADRIGAVAAYSIPSNSHYGLTDETGATVAYIPFGGRVITVTPRSRDLCDDLPGQPTRIVLENGGWDVDLTGNASPTSVGIGTTRRRPRAVAGVVRTGPLCGTCFTYTPVQTGICENCE